MNLNFLKGRGAEGGRNGVGCIRDASVIRNNELRLSLNFRNGRERIRGKVLCLKGALPKRTVHVSVRRFVR